VALSTHTRAPRAHRRNVREYHSRCSKEEDGFTGQIPCGTGRFHSTGLTSRKTAGSSRRRLLSRTPSFVLPVLLRAYLLNRTSGGRRANGYPSFVFGIFILAAVAKFCWAMNGHPGECGEGTDEAFSQSVIVGGNRSSHPVLPPTGLIGAIHCSWVSIFLDSSNFLATSTGFAPRTSSFEMSNCPRPHCAQ